MSQIKMYSDTFNISHIITVYSDIYASHNLKYS